MDQVILTILKYHLGTIIKVSFLVPVLAIPKIIFDFLVGRLMNAKQTSILIRFTISSFACCIHVYKRWLRYLSIHSYVQTAVWGCGYKDASQKAYFLLNRNENNISSLEFLQQFIILQIKVKIK